jgi:general secretion pathway protein D
MKKIKFPMYGAPEKEQRPAMWRHWSATIVLLLATMTLQPAHAQDTNREEPRGTNAINGPGVLPNTQPATGANKDAPPNTGTLNFVDADIESVIAAVGDYTNTTFIIDPRVKGTITLVSEKPLTKAQAFQLLTSVLRLRGYTVVTGNGYSKVVPEADAKLQAGPIQSGGVRGDQIATQVFHLNFESAASLVAVLRPLISPNNTINANPGNNTLVITDYADNLLRLGKIIAALDSPASSDLDVIPIRYAIASDIAVMVNRLMEPVGAPGVNAGNFNILVYPRTNSVVVRAPTEARANLAKALIARLDQPTAHPGNVHVVYLKNAEATKLAQTLRAVVTSDSSMISSASDSSTPLSPVSSQTSASPRQSSAPALSQLSSGGAGGFIQADPTTNTLIITASDSVYRDLRTVIDQLDARRAQVYIESLIVEVSATKAAELGVQWAGLSGDGNSSVRVGLLTGFSTGGNNLINQSIAKAAGTVPLPPGNGLTLGLLNQAGLGALAHALESDSSANILSMPNLITLDNEEAKIIVGQNVPFVTGQYTTPASAGAVGVNPFQTVERQDIGLTLRVKPQISQGGTVKLSIYQENSGIDNTVNTQGAGLATTKRSLDTNVLVDDGQIIVLGGLIDDNMQDTVEKVPGLGDIPLIGGLFRYKTHNRVKRNLMVFLRPTIIRNNEQSVNLAVDRYDYIRNAEINGQPNTTGLPSTEAPQLAPLKDGQISGGVLSKRLDNGSLPPTTEPNAATDSKPEPPAELPVPQQPATAAPSQ